MRHPQGLAEGEDCLGINIKVTMSEMMTLLMRIAVISC